MNKLFDWLLFEYEIYTCARNSSGLEGIYPPYTTRERIILWLSERFRKQLAKAMLRKYPRLTKDNNN